MSGPGGPGRSFRLVCAPDETEAVESLLAAEGYAWEAEPFHPLARRLVREPAALGESLAARFGLLYILDRSSMLPPLLLDPPAGASVLDMCASPGSKTGFLAQLVGPRGFVLGNEPSRDRLETLRANLRRLNLARAATCSYAGESLPLREGSWPFILLDPPCSGWGTLDKNPQAAVLWTEDKTAPLIELQRTLLRRACALLAPGGTLVFSTCTTHHRENEEQVRFALGELPLALSPAAPFPGFVFDESLPGVLRVAGDQSQAQGFFLARFVKADGPAAGADGAPGDGLDAGAAGADRADRAEGRTDRPDDGQRAARTGSAARMRPAKPGRPERGGRRPSRPGRSADSLGLPGCALQPDGLLADLGPLAEAARAAMETGGLAGGRFYDFSGRVFFLPEQAFDLLPPGLRWQGFPVGKLAGGVFRPDPRLRPLLPRAALTGAPGLDADDPALLRRLLRGESLPLAGDGKYAVLAWRALPLGLLKVRAGRAFWSEK